MNNSCNRAEQKIRNYHIFFDRFYVETNTIFQFHECHQHGHTITVVWGKKPSFPLNFDYRNGKLKERSCKWESTETLRAILQKI